MALYGVRARTIPEDQEEAELKKELRSLLPEVFGGTSAQEIPLGSVAAGLRLRSAARYEQIRAKNWFIPIVRKYLARWMTRIAKLAVCLLIFDSGLCQLSQKYQSTYFAFTTCWWISLKL